MSADKGRFRCILWHPPASRGQQRPKRIDALVGAVILTITTSLKKFNEIEGFTSDENFRNIKYELQDFLRGRGCVSIIQLHVEQPVESMK